VNLQTKPEDILIRNALVITLDGENTIHQSADVLVSGGKIVDVGQSLAKPDGFTGRTINADGMLLMPGLVNAHTHSPANHTHGSGDRQSHPAFMWMSQALTSDRTSREIYVGAMLGAIQMLMSGTTAIIDHFPGQACTSEEIDAVMAAHRDSGMRTALGLRFYDDEFGDILPRGNTVPEDVVAEMRRLNPLRPMPLDEVRAVMEQAIDRWDGAESGRLRVFPAPSNPERCSDEALVMCRDLAAKHDLGIHTHLLESKVQAVIAQEKYGCSMVEHLGRLDVLGPRLSCAHAIWVDENDIELLADTGTIVVHNPESNMKIGTGTAPIPRMMERGVRVALGTDGAGTNDNLVLHEALRLAAMLHRPAEPDRRRWLSALDVLRMATDGGAHALLEQGRIGSIEPGRRADLVLYSLDAPWWVPMNDPLNQFVFAENGSSADTVIVDGRILVENRRVLSFDADSILAEGRTMMQAILERNADIYRLAQKMGDFFP
jgi:5-methylthioadenosine/S-adenosylhomocysteine deaminase